MRKRGWRGGEIGGQVVSGKGRKVHADVRAHLREGGDALSHVFRAVWLAGQLQESLELVMLMHQSLCVGVSVRVRQPLPHTHTTSHVTTHAERGGGRGQPPTGGGAELGSAGEHQLVEGSEEGGGEPLPKVVVP